MNFAKPNTLKLIEGDRGHRTKEYKSRFEFIPGKPPSCPKDHDEVGRHYWKKHARIYLISEADISEFSYICQLQSEIEKMKQVIEQEGYFFIKVSVDGAGVEHQEKKEHPATKRLDSLRKEKSIREKMFIVRANAVSMAHSKDPVEGLIR